jgi:hypothetical protein
MPITDHDYIEFLINQCDTDELKKVLMELYDWPADE